MDSKNVAARSAAFGNRVVKSFFDIHDQDSRPDVARKVGLTAFRRLVYKIADYWLMFLSATFIIFMDVQFDYEWLGLFFLMWAFDIIVAFAFVVIWKRTGEDVTLGEAFRRAADTIHHRSRLAGHLAFLGVIVKACFWDGPEHIVIFFHKEIKTEIGMLVILLVLTAIQAAIWTPIYVLGFKTATDLLRYIM